MHNYISTNKIKLNSVVKNIVYFEKTTSTNTVAKETDYKDGTLVIAETQTAGKGRMGRFWESEEHSGIYMSFVLMPTVSADRISMLTLVAGISVCNALTKLFNIPFKIKWPNDIVAEGKKVCGILTEGVISCETPKAIVGIGINVNNQCFGDDLADKASSLFMLTGKTTERESIINAVAKEFEKNYNDFISGKPFIKNYTELCININREVTVIKDNKQIKATATGITENGELTVKKEDGTTLNINSGEVSVRGIYGYY